MTRQNSDKQLGRPGRRWQPGRWLLDAERLGAPLDLAKAFPHQPTAPLEVEIGVGKGTFILARAKQRPEVNLLGIEYAASYAAYAADRARRAGLENVRLLAADAETIVGQHLADASVLRVHIYFPDPWPKRRHLRRRLIQPPFIDHVRRVLPPGGQLLIVTDHRDYFEHMQRVLHDAPGFARTHFPQMLDSDEHIVGTNFEKKYIEEGRSFFRIALVKYGD
ncbi:MAG: tRNA (guanosine(46)-N7)-methyltransferase TrmB [Planctomycetes bacterium]|jgi:tRNA (guanine-N7-)-methyltransferase|nr:tRNA (guanosine(46)-N7)-methyltransferase TrmB [Planctomycetota bacterium]